MSPNQPKDMADYAHHVEGVKGPVMDKLKETHFYQRMKGEIFFTTDLAFQKLGGI